jgi:hypothetical protein
MSYVQLKTCLGDAEQAAVTQKLGANCIVGSTCTPGQLSGMATAAMTGLQCAQVAQICHMYNAAEYSEAGQECIAALSAGLCKASTTINTPAGSLPSCRSNFAANQTACAAMQNDCNTHFENSVQLAALGTGAPTDAQQALQQAQQAAAQRLATQGCPIGSCQAADKDTATLQAACVGVDSFNCGRNGPCTWDDVQQACAFDATATYQCSSFPNADTCNKHNCAWNPRMCQALPQDSLGCTGNATQDRCLAPDCTWSEVPDVSPTTNLAPSTVECVQRSRDVVNAVDAVQTPGTGVSPTTSCRLDPAAEKSLNAKVGNGVGTTLAETCPLFQQESMCELYGCTWTSQQTWKCTSASDASLEPLCNTIQQYAQCNMLRGMCQSVQLSTADSKGPPLCAADCNWESEAATYYSAGVAVGKYEAKTHVKLGVDNVANLLGYTAAFTQKPTAACPRVCDGQLLKMWLEEGMNSTD